MAKSNAEKVMDSLDDTKRATLTALSDPARWAPTPDGYFKCEVPQAEYMKVSNMLMSALLSGGLELDAKRYERTDGAHRSANGQLSQMLMTDYAPDPRGLGYDNVPVGYYLKLDADHLKTLGIPLATGRVAQKTAEQTTQRQ